eukprot:2921342-Pyramimonas_sp.AAC.1
MAVYRSPTSNKNGRLVSPSTAFRRLSVDAPATIWIPTWVCYIEGHEGEESKHSAYQCISGLAKLGVISATPNECRGIELLAWTHAAHDNPDS